MLHSIKNLYLLLLTIIVVLTFITCGEKKDLPPKEQKEIKNDPILESNEFEKFNLVKNRQEKIEIGQKLIKKYPIKSEAILGEMLKLYLFEEKYEDAIKTADIILKSKRLEYSWVKYMAQYFINKEIHLEEALKYAQKAAELFKRQPKTYEKLHSSEWKYIIPQIYSEYLFTVAECFNSLNRISKSELTLMEVLRHDPYSGKALQLLGEIKESKKNYNEALILQSQAAFLNKQNHIKKVQEKLAYLFYKSNNTEITFDDFMETKLKEYNEILKQKYIKQILEWKIDDFELEDINIKAVKLSDYNGKIIILIFWTTWCGSCKQEMPFLNKIYKEFNKNNIKIIGINCDQEKPNLDEDIKNYIKKYSIKFTNLVDGLAVYKKYFVTGFPTTFIIDKSGFIRFKHKGYNIDLNEIIKLQIKYVQEEFK